MLSCSADVFFSRSAVYGHLRLNTKCYQCLQYERVLPVALLYTVASFFFTFIIHYQ